MRTPLKIFISSPSDVAEERVTARKVIGRLQDQYAQRAELEPIFWEHEPLLASETFQDQIPRPHDMDVVVCLLWTRLGTRLPSQYRRADGTTYASGTEFEFEDALSGFQENGRPALLFYRKTAVPTIVSHDPKVMHERANQMEAVAEFCKRIFHEEADGTLKRAFHEFEAPSHFEELLEEHLRRLIDRRLQESGASVRAARRSPLPGGSPFRGLESFDYEHAPYFFGRTRSVSEILNALRKQSAGGHPFVLVIGGSGSGKSSLARAGVLPVLTQPGVIEGVGLWRRAIMRPGESAGDLFDGLAAALIRPEALPEIESHGTSCAELAKLLRENPAAALQLVKVSLFQAAGDLTRAKQLRKQPESRLALLLDPMEELFTTQRVSTDERRRFVGDLNVLSHSGMTWILATMRSDFLGRCSEVPELGPLIEAGGTYHVTPPSAGEIALMIREPSRLAGLEFEQDSRTGERLDDLLIEAAGRDANSLPLLQFALQQLYNHRTNDGLLTHVAYAELGRLEGAIANRAEAVYEGLSESAYSSLPYVLSRLVDVGGDHHGITVRRLAALSDVSKTEGETELVNAFVAARLFVTDKTNDGTPIVMLAHEALLTRWNRIAEWVEANHEFLRQRADLSFLAHRWLQEFRDAEYLLPGGSVLRNALSLARQRTGELSGELLQFIQESHRFVRRRHTRRSAGAVVLLLIALTTGTIGWKAYIEGRASNLVKDAIAHWQDQKLWKTAENKFAEALEYNPRRLDTLYQLARMRHEHRRSILFPFPWTKVAEPVRKGLEIDPQHRGFRNLQAIILREEGRYEEAARTFEQLIEEDHGPYAYSYLNNLAMVRVMQGNLEDARELAAGARNLCEDRKKKIQDGALGDSLDDTNERATVAWRHLGTVQWLLNDPDACDSLQEAAKYDFRREPWQASLMLARHYLHCPRCRDSDKHLEKSIHHLLNAVKKDPRDYPDPRIRRVLALARLEDDAFADARNEAQAALSKGDLPTVNHLILAAASAGLGDARNAEKHLQRGIASWPRELAAPGDRLFRIDDGFIWFETFEELERLRSAVTNSIAKGGLSE